MSRRPSSVRFALVAASLCSIVALTGGCGEGDAAGYVPDEEPVAAAEPKAEAAPDYIPGSRSTLGKARDSARNVLDRHAERQQEALGIIDEINGEDEDDEDVDPDPGG